MSNNLVHLTGHDRMAIHFSSVKIMFSYLYDCAGLLFTEVYNFRKSFTRRKLNFHLKCNEYIISAASASKHIPTSWTAASTVLLVILTILFLHWGGKTVKSLAAVTGIRSGNWRSPSKDWKILCHIQWPREEQATARTSSCNSMKQGPQ